jgi:hypothetical protein
MRTALLVAGGLVLWVRHQVNLAPRPSFNNQLYFEDTTNSEAAAAGGEGGAAAAGFRQC